MKPKGFLVIGCLSILFSFFLAGCKLDEPIFTPVPGSQTARPTIATIASTSTPIFTPTVQITKNIFITSPIPTGSQTSSKKSPCEFIKGYFQSINDRNYTKTWNLLSEHFRNDYHENEYQPYEDWWNTVVVIQIPSCKVEQAGIDQAHVKVKMILDYYNGARGTSTIMYELVMDDSRNTWLIDDGYVVKDTSQSNQISAVISHEIYYVALRRSEGYRTKNDDVDIIYKIPAGERVKILDGPRRADGVDWWYVSWKTYKGWIADHTGSGKVILKFEP